MLDLCPILARLATIDGMGSRVALSASIQDAIAVNMAQDRYLWLAGPNGASGETQGVGRILQPYNQRFSVVTLVRNVRDAAGSGALTDVAELRRAVAGLLLGFEPGAGFGPIRHVRDALVVWDGSRLYWADEYATDSFLRQQ